MILKSCMKRLNILSHKGMQIILAVSLYLLLSESLPPAAHRGLYTFSVLIKDVLLWFIPVGVMFFITATLSSFKRSAPFFIILIFIFEAASNFTSVWFGFFCAKSSVYYLSTFQAMNTGESLVPFWKLPIARPNWWSVQNSIIMAIILGCMNGFYNKGIVNKVIEKGRAFFEFVMTKIFARIAPIFILGFVAQMNQGNSLSSVFEHYAMLALLLILFVAAYIALLLLVGNNFSIRGAIQDLRNLLPAMVMAFSTGCSLSTMPVTIECAAKNLHNKSLAKAIIPTTTNIQQIGDCLINSFLCFTIYVHFNGVIPSYEMWFSFSMVFVMARFGTAAFMGGAIFIMIPIYQAYLGFTAEMIALILALNAILDPIVTCGNVVGNAALCKVFEKLWNWAIGRVSVINSLFQARRKIS